MRLAGYGITLWWGRSGGNKILLIVSLPLLSVPMKNNKNKNQKMLKGRCLFSAEWPVQIRWPFGPVAC